MIRDFTEVVQNRDCAKGIQPCKLSNQGITKQFFLSPLKKAQCQAPG